MIEVNEVRCRGRKVQIILMRGAFCVKGGKEIMEVWNMVAPMGCCSALMMTTYRDSRESSHF